MLFGTWFRQWHVVLSALHVVLQVGEGDLELDHPELGEVARGVGVLRRNVGPNVHTVIAHVRLHVELPGDSEAVGSLKKSCA